MNDLYNRIEALCERAGITITAMCRESGASRGSLSDLKMGRVTSLNTVTLSKIAAYFGISVDYLIGNDQQTKKAPTVSGERDEAELEHLKKYRALDERGKRVVDAVLDACADVPVVKMKEIIMLPSSFAAGAGEPESQVAQMEQYAVPADSPADFAIRISGDSMAPWLMDGDVALCRAVPPQQGQVAAIFLDGAFLCKQMVRDNYGNFYLFSLNRDRSELDTAVMASGDRAFRVYGAVMIDRKLPPVPTALGEP